jgi:hypothetical protein
MKCEHCGVAPSSSVVKTTKLLLNLCGRCADAWWAKWTREREQSA